MARLVAEHLTPEHLLDELRVGGEFMDRHLEQLEGVVRRYHGPGYPGREVTGPTAETAPSLENTDAEMVSLMLPKATWGNPRVRVRTARRQDRYRVRAKALAFALNHWIEETDMHSLNKRVFVDWMLSHGVVVVTPEKRPPAADNEDPRGWPQAKRLSPWDFRCDPQAYEPGEWAWTAHRVTRPKSDLVRWAKENPDEDWNLDAIEAMPTIATQRDGREALPGERYRVDREMVAYWEIWVPDAEFDGKDDQGRAYTSRNGYNGGWFTVTEDGEPSLGWIREPRPFFGPRWGPHVVGSCYPVTDEALDLSPSAMVRVQSEDLNLQARVVSNGAASYKRGVAVSDADAIEKINDGIHDHLWQIDVPDLRAGVLELELGGISEQNLLAFQNARDRYNRASGIHEAMRGETQGGTATEAAIAQNASGDRMGYQIQEYRLFVMRILKSIAWYLDRMEDVEIELTADEAEAIGVSDQGLEVSKALDSPLTWRGGERGSGMFPFDVSDTFEFDIIPVSMSRVNPLEEQQRWAQAFQALQTVAMMGTQTPYIDWRQWLELEGERLDLPQLAELVNVQVLEQVQDLMLGQQIAGQGPGQTAPQPRMSNDRAGQGQGVRPRPEVGVATHGAGEAATSNGRLAGRQSGAQSPMKAKADG